jgi:FkbM family methyltransferase
VASTATSAKVRLMRFPRLYAGARRASALSRHYVLRRPHDPEFEVFRRFSSLQGTFLDVGANEGKAALSFRLMNATAPILCIEPNPFHEKDLRALRRPLRAFDYRIAGAGARPGRMTLHVPIFRGVPLTGLASLVPVDEMDLSWWLERHGLQDQAGAISFSAVEVEVLPLDTLGLAPSFLKIDVEGFELEVLEGLRSTIDAHHPIVFIERSERFEEIGELLSSFGYAALAFDVRRKELVAPQTVSSTNAVFLHEQHLAHLHGARSHQLA